MPKRGANVVSTAMLEMADDKVLRELGTKQVRQNLQTALTIYVLRMQDSRVGDMFNVAVVDNECPPTYIIVGSYLQLVILGGTKQTSVQIFRFLVTPTVLEVLYYSHALHFLELT